MTLHDQMINMKMTEQELEENALRIKQSRARAMKAYVERNREKVNEYYNRKYYNTNENCKKSKRMQLALKRYNSGVKVSNNIIDEMRDHFKKDANEMPYKRLEY